MKPNKITYEFAQEKSPAYSQASVFMAGWNACVDAWQEYEPQPEVPAMIKMNQRIGEIAEKVTETHNYLSEVDKIIQSQLSDQSKQIELMQTQIKVLQRGQTEFLYTLRNDVDKMVLQLADRDKRSDMREISLAERCNQVDAIGVTASLAIKHVLHVEELIQQIECVKQIAIKDGDKVRIEYDQEPGGTAVIRKTT